MMDADATPLHPCDLYQELRLLYDRCNAHFFQGRLPSCMILLRPKAKTWGYFRSACWGFHQETKIAVSSHDSITLNSLLFHQHPDKEIFSTLAHEMVHLWQEHHGETKPAAGYHNREWAEEMVRIGLMPSSTGKPGGKQTGQRVADYILEPGPFQTFYEQLREEYGRPLLSWYEVPKLSLAKEQPKKLRQQCPTCDAKAWALEGVQLICGVCHEEMCPALIQMPLFMPQEGS